MRFIYMIIINEIHYESIKIYIDRDINNHKPYKFEEWPSQYTKNLL